MRAAIATLALLAPLATAETYLTWTAPEENTEGYDISREALEYHVYASPQDVGVFSRAHSTSDTEWMVTGAARGCWDVYVTASYASDSRLESEPSNMVTVCLGREAAETERSQEEREYTTRIAPLAPFLNIEEK